MNTKLTTITTQYSKFSDNQVLTKGQLNQFLEYFEDQDHLSRISLSGVGIVCGFDITYNGSKKEIYITKGYGVTTDGDLLALVEPKKPIEGQVISPGFQLVQNAFKTYTHFRSFDDSNALYAPFIKEETQIELLEIFPEEDIDTTNTTYTNLNTLSNAELNDKVVLLYLENYPKKGDLCTALDCDNQGIEQIARLRVLLVSTDDAKSIAGQDPIYNEHDWYEYYLALPEIAVRRDILTDENTKEFIRLKQNYYKLIKDNDTLADLSIGLDAILQKFGNNTISSDISALFDISPSAVPIDFQYRYDVLKDLVDTYTEIKNLLLHLNVHCCPSIGSFPKHLLLGRLVETQTHYKSLRHRFYKSPIIGHEDTNLKKVKSLLNRVQLIIKNYLETEKGEEIKITPSRLRGLLSHKTIPFYYNVTNAFLNNWSYEKYQNFTQTSNLSYHTANLSTSPVVRKPLLHAIDNYNFLRIEGIQGKSYRDALDQVLILKKEYGLNFDVKVLSVNPTIEDIDLGEYRCEFEDLNVLLKAWTTEQECILASMANFFSGFTTDKVGDNIRKIDYTQIKQVPNANIEINPDITADVLPKGKVSVDFNIDKQPILSRKDQLLFGKQTRKPYQKNVIDESIIAEEKTIGRYMKEAFEENKKGSANDIKNAAKSKIDALLSTDEWNAKPNVRDFIYNDVIDLLSVTYILSERIPQSISEIDTGNIDTYELTLDEVCQLVKRFKVTYQTLDLEDTLKDILGLLINQLSFVCCSGEKLAILLDEIEQRKEEILTQLQLSEFVKKHPGLRHYGGVPEGGTFVMAYLTGNAEDNVAYEPVRLELEFLEQPKVDEVIINSPFPDIIIDKNSDDRIINKRLKTPFDTNGGIIKLWDDRISTRFIFLEEITKVTPVPRNEIVMIGDSIEETVYNLAEFFNNIWRVAGLSKKCKAIPKENRLYIELLDQNIRKEENFIQFLNPAIINTNERIFFDENEIITRNLTTRNTVIADFALPYMCCSDCAPVNFIIPKEPVSLSLPTSFICLDDSTTPIPFTVSPPDGEVKAVVEGDISGGVIQNDDGTYAFDANQIHSSLIGTAIRFTVNDEETTAVITVYENPQPVVIVLEDDFVYNDDRTRVEAFFEVSGTGINTTSVFAWNFGDNTPISSVRPGSDGIVSHIYTLPIAPDNTVSPTLTVTNELCANDADINDITFLDPITSLILDDSNPCVDPESDQEEEISFNVQPQNAVVTVNGEIEGIRIDGNSILINPQEFTAYDTAITFSVNDEAQTTPELVVTNKNNFADFTCTPENPTVAEGTPSVSISFVVTGLTDEQKEDLGFNWDFGDGGVSSEIDFTHEYNTANLEPGTHPFTVVLSIEGGPCSFVQITKEIQITITDVDHTLQLDRNEVCLDPEVGFIDVGFQVIPLAPMTVEGDIPGIEVLTDTINIQHNLFDAYGQDIRFVIDGEVIESEVLVVRERPTNAAINWSPNTISVERGTTTVEVNFSIDGLTPQQETEVTAAWDFGDENTSIDLNPLHNFTIPANPTGPVSFDISLMLNTSSCDPVEVTTRTVTIEITEPDIEFNLNDNAVCFEEGGNEVVTQYNLSPDTTIDVQGNSTGISINRSTRTIRLTSAFNRFNETIRFIINGEVNTSETLIVRRELVNFGIDWSPKNIQLVDGQTEITITFTAVNYDATLYPGTNVGWEFEGGEKGNGQGAEVTFQLPTDNPQELIDFSTNGILIISGGLCDNFISDNTEITVTFNNEEPKNCNERVANSISDDYDTIKNDPSSENPNHIVNVTKALYERVMNDINLYINGDRNDKLNEAFSQHITFTSNGLLQEEAGSEIFIFASKYLRVQIRLLIHILHCQDDLNDQDIANLDPVMDVVKTALGSLSNTEFDIGDPDPKKLEGTLREFLMQCLNSDTLPNYTRVRIQDFIDLIAPIS
ncbi:hypothetical protein GCM10011344_25200 [Dokdonia pacifica]|uniref:PKD domain-containing protein n=1 Tax=Dokdonia pacifica TaxID=1627892 RepID=A0A238WRR3_9FLAO|nr:PKD domain-containing protein [Dokdonia pacifica]GGG23412.1 hypothetical protein GCM10011344_25200 [Dokdonia pacifica]SNR48944.1 hypothetical protein SAMN06265376_1011375 [Dokdonia pacifica]